MKYLKKVLVSGVTLTILLGSSPVSADTVVHTDRASGAKARNAAVWAARQKAEQQETIQAEERAEQLARDKAEREAKKDEPKAENQNSPKEVEEALITQSVENSDNSRKKNKQVATQQKSGDQDSPIDSVNEVAARNGRLTETGRSQKVGVDFATYPHGNNYKMFAIPKTPFSMPAKQRELAKLTKGIKVNHDDMSNTTYYVPKKVSADPITIYPVVIYNHDNNTVSIEFVALFVNTKTAGYFGGVSSTMGDDHFLWFDTVTVRADNQRYTIKYDFKRGHRDVQSSQGINTWFFGSFSWSVIEYYEELMDANAFSALQAITRAKDVKVRFSGKDFHVDKEMSSKKIAIEKKMLDIYELLKS